MLKLLRFLSKKEWAFVSICLVFIVAQVWLDLKLPDYMSEITTLVQTGTGTMNQILTAGAKMLLCALGSLSMTIIVAIFAARISSNFSARLRNHLFCKVQDFSLKEIGSFSTASLITRTTNDVTQVQTLFVMGLQVLIKAPILAAWAIIKIAGKNWQWTLSTGVSFVVLVISVVICLSIAIPCYKKAQKLTDNLNNVTRENITGLSVVHAYNAEKFEQNKFKKANYDLASVWLRSGNALAFLNPIINAVMSGLSLSIYWLGAIIINSAPAISKTVIFSDLIVFFAYAMQILMAFMMLIMVFFKLPRASVSAKRINEVLKTPISIVSGNISVFDAEKQGEIEFRNVSFKYPDAEAYVLQDISFCAKKGETVAIVGSTGCGKSTVINLIPRFYDVSDGDVLVNGINVKDFTLESLHNKIGYISQRATLFSGTIESNVAFGYCGKEINESDIENSIEVSQAKEFVNEQKDGMKSFVSAGGTNFSGGQKQRISIARAIYRNPEILIFDDSFSALDYKTDKLLRKTLKSKCKDTTKIIVAQRIGTILDADKIIVLENGKIVGLGKHDDLLKTCTVYQEIASSQLEKEELANGKR